MNPLIILAKEAGGLVVDWFRSARKVKEAKTNAKIKIQDRVSELDGEIARELVMGSWKDEAVLLWFLAIATACFIPALYPFVQAGIANLIALPDYFRMLFAAAILTSLGLRIKDAIHHPIFGKPK